MPEAVGSGKVGNRVANRASRKPRTGGKLSRFVEPSRTGPTVRMKY